MGYNKTGHRLFFIITTSLSLFTRVAVMLAVFLEVAMHVWAHSKNCKNSNPTIYYRSPLHEFTSQFCTRCRHESSMNQVIKMQDERHRNWQMLNLKEISRTMY